MENKRVDNNLPTAGDIERDPDDELFGEEIGLIDCCWLFCGNDCAPGPGCEETLFDGCWAGCWILAAKLAEFSIALFWAAAAASCCNDWKERLC